MRKAHLVNKLTTEASLGRQTFLTNTFVDLAFLQANLESLEIVLGFFFYMSFFTYHETV